MERYNLEEAIKILGLEMRAEMAHEGVNFDVACRTILKAVRKSEKIDELEGFYYIKNGRAHPCFMTQEVDYNEHIDDLE